MKLNYGNPKSNVLAGVALFVTTALLAQSPPSGAATESATAAAAPSAGWLNDWFREQNRAFDPFDLGAQFRPRFVYQSYFAVPGAGPTAVDFRANTPESENDFLLLRTRVHAGYTPCEWFTIYGEGQNSSSTGDKRNPNPQSDGPFDLHQGYLRIGGTQELPVSLKIGRQELAYGDERLVGAFDWDNIGRVFDAARLHLVQERFWLDAFVGRVVIPKDDRFNEPNRDDWFSGIYGSTRSIVPKTELQAYFLADNVSANSKGNTPRDIYTVGARIQTLAGQLRGWDFNGEFAGQFGDFAYAANTPGVVAGTRLNHLAFATHVEGGYTFARADFRPRIALGFDYASGDGNPNDREHNTFVNLFPTNHKFYGAMDFLSWQNMLDPYLKATITPAKRVSVAATYHAFWLATTSDFFYQANQAPRTAGGYGIHPQYGRFAGQEIDLVAAYTPVTVLQFQAGFAHFFTGDYVNQTFAGLGGAHDANWAYVQARLQF